MTSRHSSSSRRRCHHLAIQLLAEMHARQPRMLRRSSRQSGTGDASSKPLDACAIIPHRIQPEQEVRHERNTRMGGRGCDPDSRKRPGILHGADRESAQDRMQHSLLTRRSHAVGNTPKRHAEQTELFCHGSEPGFYGIKDPETAVKHPEIRRAMYALMSDKITRYGN